VRDDRGQYGFAHSSYAEYFLARDLADHISNNNIGTLTIRRLTNEVIDFLLSMVDKVNLEQVLTVIVCSEYKPLLSENALLILYRLRRNLLIAEKERSSDSTKLKVDMPSHVQLQGAKLSQVNLEGAVLQSAGLEGVDLCQCIARGADFSNASFKNALVRTGDLQEAILHDANMTSAVLAEVNFHGADVQNCDFTGADLNGSMFTVKNFTGAIFQNTVFDSAVLPRGKESYFLGRKKTGGDKVTDKDREKKLLLVSRIAKRFAAKSGVGSDSADIASDVVLFLLSHPTELARLPKPGDDFVKMVGTLTLRRIEALARDRRMFRSLQTNEANDQNAMKSQGSEEQWPYPDDDIQELGEPVEISWEQLDQEIRQDSNFLAILGESLTRNALRMLIARYVEEDSVEEIAKDLKLPEIEVVRQLNKARELARAALTSR
jgi:uncharacterized protein YjbI with pentapeptide repeats